MPVSKLKSNPVAALELLVDLYLDPEIASPRKVSVWYSFWGEASSRQEYYDICGQKDESFAALVRELIGRLIEASAQRELDADGVALGLIGVLEMLWQDFAFRSEDDIDRRAARRRAMAYLKSIFPGQFVPPAARPAAEPRRAGVQRFAGWAYGHERAFALERAVLFHAWQAAAHESELPRAGDFVTADLGVERVLLIRDSYGAIQALRNSCPEVPHALVTARRGRIEDHIDCPVHGLKFDRNGRSAGGGARGPGAAGSAHGRRILAGALRSRRGARRAPLAGGGGSARPCGRSRRRPISKCRRTGSCSPNSGSPRPTRRRTEPRGRVAQLELASRGRAELERRALPAARRQRGGRALASAIRGAESIAAVASGRRDAAAGDRSGARTLPRAANSPHAPHVGARSGGRAIPLGAAHAPRAALGARRCRIGAARRDRFRLSARRGELRPGRGRLVPGAVVGAASGAVARASADRFVVKFTILPHRARPVSGRASTLSRERAL